MSLNGLRVEWSRPTRVRPERSNGQRESSRARATREDGGRNAARSEPIGSYLHDGRKAVRAGPHGSVLVDPDTLPPLRARPALGTSRPGNANPA